MDYVDKSDVEVFSLNLTLVIYQRENDDLVNDLIFSLCKLSNKACCFVEHQLFMIWEQ